MSNGGKKHDDGKARFDLIPPWPLEQVAIILTQGASEYGEYNWHKGIANRRLYAAAQRHLNAVAQGNLTDGKSGMPHLAHAATNLLMMLDNYYAGRKPGGPVYGAAKKQRGKRV